LMDSSLHHWLTNCLDVDLVGKTGHSRLQIVRIGPRQIGPIERGLLRGGRCEWSRLIDGENLPQRQRRSSFRG
jgi:hypothetical protein